MRVLPVIGALSAAMLWIGISQAQAAPATVQRQLGPDPIVKVQMQCNHNRCIDPRTGAYTQSGCNRGGCYPISGVVGYDRPRVSGSRYGYREGYGQGYGSELPPGRYRGQRWDRHYGE